MTGPNEQGLPFTIEAQGPLVLVHRFRPDLDRYFVGLERGLPVLRDAVRTALDQGSTTFLFDIRPLAEHHVYPVVKWGAMYGVVAGLRRRHAAWRADDPEGFRRLVGRSVG